MGKPTDIEISCADFAFPLIPHATCLQLIAGIGISAVDVSIFTGGPFLTPEEVLQDTRGTAARLRSLLDRYELKTADVFPIFGGQFDEAAMNSPDAAQRNRHREDFCRLLEFALLIGAPGMTLLPGVAWPHESIEESLQRTSEELQWRAEFAGNLDVEVSVEPHHGSLIDTPARLARLLELAPGPILTLDYSHFVYEGYGPEELDVFVPRARHMHCRQAAPGIMQARVQEGTIDFDRLVQVSTQTGYRGYYSLEYVWMEKWNCNRVDNLSETVLLRNVLERAAARV